MSAQSTYGDECRCYFGRKKSEAHFLTMRWPSGLWPLVMFHIKILKMHLRFVQIILCATRKLLNEAYLSWNTLEIFEMIKIYYYCFFLNDLNKTSIWNFKQFCRSLSRLLYASKLNELNFDSNKFLCLILNNYFQEGLQFRVSVMNS